MSQLPENVEQLFKEAETNLSKKIQKISDSVHEALTLSEFNIQEKAQVAPSLHHGFVNCLFSERNTLKKLKELKLVKEEEFISKYGKDNVPKYKTAQLIANNDEILKINMLIEEQNDAVKYLEEVCRIMSAFNFSIKNAVDLMKLSD